MTVMFSQAWKQLLINLLTEITPVLPYSTSVSAKCLATNFLIHPSELHKASLSCPPQMLSTRQLPIRTLHSDTEHYHSWILTWSGHNRASCYLPFAECGIQSRSRHATNLPGCLFTKQLWAHRPFYPGLQVILELLVPRKPSTSGCQ